MDLVFVVGMLVVYAILMVGLAREQGRAKRAEKARDEYRSSWKTLLDEVHEKDARIVRLEQMWRGRDPFIAKLQSLHDRGWRVVVKSHALQKRENGTAKRDEWGWLVTAIPVDQYRYSRWGVLYGAVMGTLEDAMGDTLRRVAQIEAVERSEAPSAR